MKYSELTDCPNGCPVYEEGICPGGYACYGGDPIEPPCTSFDDDTDLDEWISRYYDRQRRFDEAEDKRIKAEKAKQERNALAQKHRAEAARETRFETREIKSLRKRIAGNEAAARLARSLAFAFNTTNEMFRYEERVSPKNNALAEENEKLRARISEIEKIKKDKLAALRKRRKAGQEHEAN